MTEIKVILDSEPISDLGTLSQEERELLFDQLAADNPDIPRVIINSFAEMQTEIIHQNTKLTKPDLKELLLRKIIQLSKKYGSAFNTVVIPIIPSFTAVNLKKPAAAIAKLPIHIPTITKTGKYGGAIQPMRRMRPQESIATRQDHPGAIKIRFDMQVVATTSTGLDYIVPPNEELDVIGLVFNPICSYPNTLNSRGETTPITSIVIERPTIGNKLVLGNYKYPEASRACDDFFIHPNYSITVGGESSTQSLKIFFADLDDIRVTKVLSNIFDYLANAESYHNSLASAQFVHTQVGIAMMENGPASITRSLKEKLTIEQPDLITMEGETKDKPEILNALESIHSGKFATVYDLAVLADLDARGFARIYHKAILKGKDHADVLYGLDVYKEKQARITFQNSVRDKLLDERNKLTSYKTIIEKKLGVERLAEIEHQILMKPSITVSAKNILTLLKPAERKPVELEFDRREKYLTAVINNKCPHVKLYRQFRLARDNNRINKYFRDLKKFFKNPNIDNGMITCNNCGFDIICPHMRDFTEMDLNGEFQTKIKAKLTKYIDRAVVRDQYHCKICGEMISSLEAFGDNETIRDAASTMNEELKNFMWGEMAIITKYLKFNILVNVPQLITAMRDACYPFVFEIEKQILKSKTNSADEIKAKKRLYVTVYAFAYLIHLIMSNRTRTGDGDIMFKNFAPKNPKNAIVDMVKHALDLIIMSRNVIIREIPGMSADIIKNTLIEAYKSMQITGTQVIAYSGEAEDLLTTLLLDPVYRYIYTINIIDGIINGKKTPHGNKGKFNMVDRIDEYMGDSIAKLEKTKDVFAKIKVPKFDKWKPKIFDELKPMHRGSTHIGKNVFEGKSVYNETYSGYVARSFEVFREKLTKRLYAEPMYIDVSAGAGSRGDPNAPMDVKFREPHEKQRAIFLEFEAKEKELIKYRGMESAQNYKFLPAVNTRRWVDTGAKLGRVYDEDGNTHKWDIYVIEKLVDGKPSRAEMKSSDIAKLTESGVQFTDTITDRKCSSCGALWSRASELSEKKIHIALHSKHVVNNFFRFYENRCPKSGLHEFGDGNKCTKCGIVNVYLTNPTTKEAIGYYREFNSIYDKEKQEFATVETDSSQRVVKPPQDVSQYADEYTKWTFNFNALLDLANKIKINHRLLSALGAVEKQEYADVQSGVYIPPEAEARHDTRIYLVNSYVKNLITEYNQIKYFHRLVKPPIDLSIIIDGSGINKHKISELAKKLPDIFNDYNSRFLYMQIHKKPREIVSFCIQNFCEMCLIIWTDTDKTTEKLRHDFVEYFVKKILRSEELVSKPGHFNWSLLYGDKEVTQKDSYDMNFNKDLDAEKDREYEETEGEEGFGDTGAPMSAPDFDVEEDPDRDPFDDESNDNDWKVGEELGLD